MSLILRDLMPVVCCTTGSRHSKYAVKHTYSTQRVGSACTGPHQSVQHLSAGIPAAPAISKSVGVGEAGRRQNRVEGGHRKGRIRPAGGREGSHLCHWIPPPFRSQVAWHGFSQLCTRSRASLEPRRPIGATAVLLDKGGNAPLPQGEHGSCLGSLRETTVAFLAPLFLLDQPTIGSGCEILTSCKKKLAYLVFWILFWANKTGAQVILLLQRFPQFSVVLKAPSAVYMKIKLNIPVPG